MQRALSDTEIKEFIPNVVVYSDLETATPEELLESLPLVVLYQSTLNTGHWTLLHKTPEGIEFFDSYSSKPDEEFKWLNEKQPHYLARLLYQLNAEHPIIFNEDQLQELSPDINTCGRHVILRNLLSKYSIDDYVYGLKKMAKDSGVSIDQLVTDIVHL